MTFPVGPMLRRLAQGTPSRSPMRRTIAGAGPVAYWPVEDGTAAGQAGSAIAGHPPMTVTGTVSFRPVADYVDLGDVVVFGTSALADLSAGGRLAAQVPASGGTAAQWTVHVAAGGLDPASSATDVVLLEWTTPGGTYVRWRLVAQKSPTRTQVFGFNTAGTGTLLIEHIGLSFNLAEYAVSAYQVGGNVTVDLRIGDTLPVAEPNYTAAGTLASVTSLSANTTGATSTAQMPFGHVALFATASPPFAIAGSLDSSGQLVNSAWASFENEPARVRLARLCAEDGVQLMIPALTDVAAATRMGPQPVGAPLDLYRQCAEADQGVLHELGFGLRYVPRDDRYNRPVTLALDYAAGQVAPPLEPVDDDYLLTNRVTVRRVNGSEATAEDAASIASDGLYDSSVDVNLATDDDLADHAAWRVHLAAVAQWDAAELEWIARHEAAHAVTAVALGVEVDWADMHADPDYGATQTAAVDPHTDAVVFLAGWMADDGHIVGPLSTHDTQEALKLVGQDGIPAAMRDASAILASRRDDIATVAAALLEHGRLTGEQIKALVQTDPVPDHTDGADLAPGQRRIVAHHEAAHAVAAVHLGAEVAWVTVTMRPGEVAGTGLPAGQTYGGTMVRNVDPHTDAVVCLAGWMADDGHIVGPRRTHDTDAAYELVGADGIPAAMRDAAAILAARRRDVQVVREALIEHGRLTGAQVVALVQTDLVPA